MDRVLYIREDDDGDDHHHIQFYGGFCTRTQHIGVTCTLFEFFSFFEFFLLIYIFLLFFIRLMFFAKCNHIRDYKVI